MAVTLNGSSADYRGLSTDEKPTDAGENAWFYEQDTKSWYYFTDGAWVAMGSAPAAGEG